MVRKGPNLERWPLAGLTGEPLVEAQMAAAQDLLDDDQEYFELVQGSPPGFAEAQSLVTALPEGKTHDDKFVLALHDGADALAGLVDLVRDYPQANEWWLGLLFVAPERRNKGLGAWIVSDMEDTLRDLGAAKLRLATIERNEGALRFWKRMGYEQERRTERKMRFDLTLPVLVMAKQL